MEITCEFGEKFGNRVRVLRVTGVFSRGVYFTDGENVYMLYDRAYGGIAFGIGVENIGRVLNDIRFSEGEEWLYADRVLVRGENRFSGTGFRRSGSCKNGCLDKAAAERALRECGRGSFKEYYLGEPASGLIGRRLERNLPALEEGLRENIPEKICLSTERLIGLGEGLTPEADDFIVGMLYTFQEKQKPPSYEVFAAEVSKGLRKTTAISGAYLSCALRGAQFEAVTDVLRDLTDIEKTERLLGAGCTSGSSILVGILTAIGIIGELWNLNRS